MSAQVNESTDGYGRMEDPEERQAQDLIRKKKAKRDFDRKGVNSVSLRTYRTGTFMVQLVVWLLILGLIGYLAYMGITLFLEN